MKTSKSYKNKLPKYAMGDIIDPALTADNPYVQAGSYGSQILSALSPQNAQQKQLAANTSIGRDSSKLDQLATVGTQFLPTKGLITKGGQALGNAIESNVKGQAGTTLGMATKYGATGAEIGSLFGPVGAGVGAGVGAIAGGIAGASEYGQIQNEKNRQGLLKAQGVMDSSKQNYNNALAQGFDPRGSSYVSYKYGGMPKYANGASMNEPQWEGEKHEVVQGIDTHVADGKKIASDMTLIGGQRHENGGTQGQGGERIFSDRIKIAPALLEGLKSLGFKDLEGKSYADVAKYLGDKKKSVEKLTGTKSPYRSNTYKIMKDRLDSAINDVFESQEQSKGPDNEVNPVQKMGGNTQYAFGGGLAGGRGVGGKSNYPSSVNSSEGPLYKKKSHRPVDKPAGNAFKYEEGGEIDMDGMNKSYLTQRINEIGIEAATKEYNDFMKEESVEEENKEVINKPKKKKLFN